MIPTAGEDTGVVRGLQCCVRATVVLQRAAQVAEIAGGTLRAPWVPVRAWWLSVVVFLVTMAPGRSWAGDRLDAARKEAGSSSWGSSSSGSDDDDGGIVLGILGLLADDDDDHHHHYGRPAGVGDGSSPSLFDEPRGFLPYPYADGRRGYMRSASDGKTLPRDAHDAAFRVGAEGAYLYDDVWRSSAQFRLMVPRFYAQFRYDFFLEGPTPVVEGDLELRGTVRDRLHFATFDFGPQIFASEHLAVRFGLVGTVMFDDRRSLPQEPSTTPGAGAVIEFDAYPVRPLVLSGRGAILKLGQTVMLEARGTVGVSINRFEVYAGYDHRQIGNVHLGGPTVGVGVRF